MKKHFGHQKQRTRTARAIRELRQREWKEQSHGKERMREDTDEGQSVRDLEVNE